IKEESGNTPLLVASLTESFEDYDLTSGRNLSVEWTAPSKRSVQLRAQGLRRRLYYRMDTIRPPGSSSFTWPSDPLTALNIQRKDIGVIGWARYAVGVTEQDVYVPLRIGQRKNPAQSGNYTLILLPGVELKEVFISLTSVRADGRPKEFFRSEEALKYG